MIFDRMDGKGLIAKRNYFILTWNNCTPLVEMANITLLQMENALLCVCFGCDLFNLNRYKCDLCTRPASWTNIAWARLFDIPLWSLCNSHSVCFTLCSLFLYTYWTRSIIIVLCFTENTIITGARRARVGKGEHPSFPHFKISNVILS